MDPFANIDETQLETDIEAMKELIAREELSERFALLREEIQMLESDYAWLDTRHDDAKATIATLRKSRMLAWTLAGVCAVAALVLAIA